MRASRRSDYRRKTQYYLPGFASPASAKSAKPRLHKTLFIFAIGAIAVIILIHSTVHFSLGTAASASKNSSNTPAITKMGQTINSIIADNSNVSTSVSLIDLSSGQPEHYGVNQTFQAASTAKVLTAEYFLHEVEAGKRSLSETVNGNTARHELQQMIVVSDDNAWAAFNNLLGYNNLQKYTDKTLGIRNYQAYNNSLNSKDIAQALERLWQNKLLNSAYKSLLLSYMKQANYRQYIVPAIPSGDTIYHKIGLYEDYVNDAAIVTDGDKAFVIVIFTNGNGTYDWPNRAIMMQDITKAALKAYFNQG